MSLLIIINNNYDIIMDLVDELKLGRHSPVSNIAGSNITHIPILWDSSHKSFTGIALDSP